MNIRVILADNHTLIRDLLKMFFKSSYIEIVADVDSCRDLVLKTNTLRPDIIVMTPDLFGLETHRNDEKLFDESLQVKIIALLKSAELDGIKKMRKLGAVGFLTKYSIPDELVKAIQIVHSGGVYMCNLVGDKVLVSYVTNKGFEEENHSRLTARESEVLEFIAAGMSAKEIAERLYLSIKTINTHKQNILDKLYLNNTADLIKYAIKKGIVPLD